MTIFKENERRIVKDDFWEGYTLIVLVGKTGRYHCVFINKTTNKTIKSTAGGLEAIASIYNFAIDFMSVISDI